MSNVITLRLSDEAEARLDAYMEESGIASRGLAVKRIVEERLAAEAEADALEPLISRMEERLVRASSRGAKASIAALCLMCAERDDSMESKVSSLPAGAVFDFAWDMAGALMSHGSRPDFYRAAKMSSLIQAREEQDRKELVDAAASYGPTRMAMALDDKGALLWFGVLEDYDSALMTLVDPESTSDERFAASYKLTKAVKVMYDVLKSVELNSIGDVDALLGDEDMAFFGETQGWSYLSDDPDEEERRRERVRRLFDAD